MSAVTSPPPPAIAAHARRPRLAPSAEVHSPTEGKGDWVLQHGARYVRITSHIADLVQELDGERDHEALAARLGGVWNTERVGSAISRLDSLKLLDDGETPAPSVAPRFQIVPPMTLQLTLLRPGRTMQALRPLFARLFSRGVVAGGMLGVLFGLVALVIQRDAVAVTLNSPLSAGSFAAVLVALLVGVSIHELGHAAVLIRYGGRPSRIGVMLFYLMPAFFCDVTDAWRLPDRRQRVHTALAGPAVQTSLAAASALAAWPMADGTAKTCLLFFAVTSYGTALLNLTPFIKLDGYIALMSHVDIPYLRDRATTDARRTLARILFGGTYRRELPTRWTIAYGFACLAFPLYFLSTALQTWLGTLQRLGWVGLVLAASGLSYFAWMLIRGGLRLAAEVKSAGVRRTRVGVVCAVLAAAGCAALFLPTHQTVAAAYVTDASGTRLVLPQGASADLVRPGQQVTLKTNGLVLHDTVATARVGAAPAGETQVPVSTYFPVDLGGAVGMDSTAFALDLDRIPTLTTGTAEVELGSVPLWKSLHRTYVLPFLPF
ncbi:daptide biosynthesis intramembrane metalloprotease [Streptomyces sp. NPDC091368]|uniref:daptide biosynthesis intramembrane metalloprotease n=1 Tax=Streptomyces sp. NPDC091368 TaxID=3365993 RepID=UPI0038062A4F